MRTVFYGTKGVLGFELIALCDNSCRGIAFRYGSNVMLIHHKNLDSFTENTHTKPFKCSNPYKLRGLLSRALMFERERVRILNNVYHGNFVDLHKMTCLKYEYHTVCDFYVNGVLCVSIFGCDGGIVFPTYLATRRMGKRENSITQKDLQRVIDGVKKHRALVYDILLEARCDRDTIKQLLAELNQQKLKM